MRAAAVALALLALCGAVVPALSLPPALPLLPTPAAEPSPFGGVPTQTRAASPLAAGPGPRTPSLAALGTGVTPYEFFLQAATAPDLTAPALTAAVASYLEELGRVGLQPGRQPANADGLFDMNFTVAYTAPVHDVDGDGVRDVVLDLYCTNAARCKPSTPPVGVDYVNSLARGTICGHAHRVALMSGANGTEIWSRRVDVPYALGVGHAHAGPQYSCTQEFVLGTIPVGDAVALLIYRFTALGSQGQFQTRHTYYALDVAKEEELWRLPEIQGVLVVEPATGARHAENLLVNPILQLVPEAGPSILPATMRPVLFLQGVGFDVHALSTPPPPGYNGGLTLYDAYRPNEWAAHIDLATGREVWRAETFDWQEAEDAYVSLVPQALFPNAPFHPNRNPASTAPGFQSRPCYAPVCPEVPGLGVAEVKAEWYWSPYACCYDVSGDGVPDLVYVTHAWSSTPSHRPEGTPRHTLTRLHVFNGADGSPLYDPIVIQDRDLEHTACFIPLTWFSYCTMVLPEALGDVTGDGKSDFLLHVVHYGFDYYHNITVHDGSTGAKLWERVSRLNQYVLPLGEVDAEPGVDFALFDWFNENFWFFQSDSYSFANVTSTDVTARRGSTGEVLWRATGFIAPVDLAITFDTYRLNGLPDFNGDGVGDLVLDDPLYYPDLTVVHRSEIISGKDGKRLFRFNSVGAFSFPTRAGDVTGDGVDDLGVLSGDVNDLWLTTHDGTNGQPLWSRRVLASRASSYDSAVVRMRMHDLGGPSLPERDVLLNLHFRITSNAGQVFTASNTPQLAAFRALNGSSDWAVPAFRSSEFAVVLPGTTPLTQMYERAYARPAELVPVQASSVAVGSGLGFLTFGLTFGLGYGSTLLRRKFL